MSKGNQKKPTIFSDAPVVSVCVRFRLSILCKKREDKGKPPKRKRFPKSRRTLLRSARLEFQPPSPKKDQRPAPKPTLKFTLSRSGGLVWTLVTTRYCKVGNQLETLYIAMVSGWFTCNMANGHLHLPTIWLQKELGFKSPTAHLKGQVTSEVVNHANVQKLAKTNKRARKHAYYPLKFPAPSG